MKLYVVQNILCVYFSVFCVGYLGPVTRSAIWHENCTFVDVPMQFQLLFQHLHVPGPTHSGVRWNKIQTRRAKT